MTSSRSLLLAAAVAAPLVGCTSAPEPEPAAPPRPVADDYVGKWNIRITDTDDTFAGAQIDVEKKGDGVAAGLVWRWASYGPATTASVEDGVLRITRKVEVEEGQAEAEEVFEARLEDGMLKGTARYPDGNVHHFEGRPGAAASPRAASRSGASRSLSSTGRPSTAGSLRDPKAKMGWAVVDGELAVVEPKDNADLVSERSVPGHEAPPRVQRGPQEQQRRLPAGAVRDPDPRQPGADGRRQPTAAAASTAASRRARTPRSPRASGRPTTSRSWDGS